MCRNYTRTQFGLQVASEASDPGKAGTRVAGGGGPGVIQFSDWLRLSVAHQRASRPQDARPKAMSAGSFIGPEAQAEN